MGDFPSFKFQHNLLGETGIFHDLMKCAHSPLHVKDILPIAVITSIAQMNE